MEKLHPAWLIEKKKIFFFHLMLKFCFFIFLTNQVRFKFLTYISYFERKKFGKTFGFHVTGDRVFYSVVVFQSVFHSEKCVNNIFLFFKNYF
jgi:hypothetical protein